MPTSPTIDKSQPSDRSKRCLPPALRLYLLRLQATFEVSISKLFPAGFGWQAGGILANGVGLSAYSLPYAIATGVGDGLGVFLGHLLYSSFKRLIDDSIDIHVEFCMAFFLASSSFCSGFMWQPAVNTLEAMNVSFFLVVIGTWIWCGLAFFVGLRLFRYLYHASFGIPAGSDDNFKKDLYLSFAIGGGSGAFVGTITNYENDAGNFLSSWVGEFPYMSNLECCFKAGLSTAMGFAAVQCIENFFYAAAAFCKSVGRKVYRLVYSEEGRKSDVFSSPTVESMHTFNQVDNDYLYTPPTSRSWRAVSVEKEEQLYFGINLNNRSSWNDFEIAPPTSSTWRAISYADLSKVVGNSHISGDLAGGGIAKYTSSMKSKNPKSSELDLESQVHMTSEKEKRSRQRSLSRGRLSFASLATSGISSPLASTGLISSTVNFYHALDGENSATPSKFVRAQTNGYINDVLALAVKRNRQWEPHGEENKFSVLSYSELDTGIEFKSSRVAPLAEEDHFSL